jgi:hypothetical protein
MEGDRSFGGNDEQETQRPAVLVDTIVEVLHHGLYLGLLFVIPTIKSIPRPPERLITVGLACSSISI